MRRAVSACLPMLLALGFLTAMVGAPAVDLADDCDKGPVGWDVYRELEGLPLERCGVETHQFSSYNRAGDNGDGSTSWACYRTDPEDGCVIAEANGPGEIDSIWFTRDRGNVTLNGNIRIDLDGVRVLDAPLQDVVDGELGAPFTFPLVANADESSGGSVIKVPMPFRESMQVSVDTTRYYHVTWRSFADAEDVATFDPTDPATDVHDRLAAWGTEDPKELAPEQTIEVPLPAGTDPVEVALPDGAWVVTELAFLFPNDTSLRPVPQVWEETPILAHEVTREGTGNDYYPNYIPDQTVHALDGTRGIRLQLTFDGRQTVDAPLPEFFGVGTGRADVASLMFTMAEDPTAWLRSWWPMPYTSSASLRLERTEETPGAVARIQLARAPEVTDALAAGRAGYFHATSRGQVTELGRDYTFLDTAGRGHVVGIVHTMYPGPYEDPTADPYSAGEHAANGVIRTALEGDERFHADGSRTPQWYGTGNEDLYEGAWYYNRSVFSNPLNGNPMHEQSEGCEVGCTGAYRLFLGEAVTFTDGVHLGIEVGGHNDEVRTFTSTTFWYGDATAPASVVTDTLDLGDPTSETARGFTGGGDVTELTATFDGDDDDVEVTEDLRTSTSVTSFTLALDREAQVVRLRRMSDQLEGGQAARVLVDGREVGTWIQPLHNPHHRWVEDTFTIPPEATRGKARIRVTLEPLGGAPAWTAARYEAISTR